MHDWFEPIINGIRNIASLTEKSLRYSSLEDKPIENSISTTMKFHCNKNDIAHYIKGIRENDRHVRGADSRTFSTNCNIKLKLLTSISY